MIMVVSQFKEQVVIYIDDGDDIVEMSVEEFFEQCENVEGIWY